MVEQLISGTMACEWHSKISLDCYHLSQNLGKPLVGMKDKVKLIYFSFKTGFSNNVWPVNGTGGDMLKGWTEDPS